MNTATFELSNRRHELRHRVRVPVRFEHGSGLTRDLSLAGVYFETEAPIDLSSPIRFTIAFEQPEGTISIQCEGHVVRIEPQGSRSGVAVAINDLILSPCEN